MRYWFIVHDIEAFNEGLKSNGSNTIGFNESTYNAKNIEPGDMIVYYLKFDIAIKGIYQVKPKPWRGVKSWISDYQIDILPVILLKEACDFKEIRSSLELFKDIDKWQLKIQGTNGVRELSEADFMVLKDYVAKYALLEKEFVFPSLRPDSRVREYNSVSEQLRDEVIYEYLFNGQSHRLLDEDVLGLDAKYTRGYMAMGVLHHVGLWDEHKSVFEGYSILDAIEVLSKQDKNMFKPVILALMRFNEGLYSDDSINYFRINTEISPLLKNVGTSQYTDGVRIEKEYHDIFNPPDSSLYTSRGTTRSIKVLFNNKIFDAEYRFEGQEDKAVILQSIRFRKELKEEFQKVFPEPMGQFTIQTGRDLNHFIFSHSSVVFDDEEEFEEDDIEYDETKQAFRLHRIRERKPEVVRKAKDNFLKKHGRLFCQACGFDFKKVYGVRGTDFIEGHHTKLVSEMKDGEKTKVEDIALICSNCHRMIHRKPLLNVEELAELINCKSKFK